MTSPELSELLLAAVADAINYLEDQRAFCPDCRTFPGGVCPGHEDAAYLAARYTEIHVQLRKLGPGHVALGGTVPSLSRSA